MKQQFSLANIYKLAWPAIISHATVMFVGIIDLAFIARLPNATIAVAAAAIANNVCGGIYAFLEGLRSGTTILIAQFFGAKDSKNITKTFNIALYYALIIGGTLFLLTPFFSIAVYYFFEKDISQLGRSYLTLRLIGLPFHLTIFAIIGLFRGLKNTVMPLFITGMICIFDAMFNYFFMYGKIGFSPLGMNGIALGTASSYILGAILSFALILTLPFTKKYLRFTNFTKSFSSIRSTFIKVGSEIGLYSGVIIIALFIFVFLFIPLGSEAIAAHQIAFQAFLVTYLPPMGFFVAASIIIGKLLGEKEHHFIIPATIKIWASSLPIVAGVSLIAAFFAPQISRFFSPTNANVANMATDAIYLICITQLLCSIFTVLKGSLAAVKDTRFLLVAGSITSYFFFLPTAYLLGITFGYGVWGGYIALLLWTLLDDIIFAFRLFVQKPFKNQ